MEDLRDMDRDVEQEAFERSPGLRFQQVSTFFVAIPASLAALAALVSLIYWGLAFNRDGIVSPTSAAVGLWWSAFALGHSLLLAADGWRRRAIFGSAKYRRAPRPSFVRQHLRSWFDRFQARLVLRLALLATCIPSAGLAFVYYQHFAGDVTGAWLAFACAIICSVDFCQNIYLHRGQRVVSELGEEDIQLLEYPGERPVPRVSWWLPVVRAIIYFLVFALVLVQGVATFQAVRVGYIVHANQPAGALLQPQDLPYRLRLQCAGSGAPTVVLDSGLGLSGLPWLPILENSSKFARTCLYDRAGYGWSESGQLPRTAAQFAFELRGLLTAAGEKAPFLLVSQGTAGLAARVFAAIYPAMTAGLVLVDSAHENESHARNVSEASIRADIRSRALRLNLLRLFAPLGVVSFFAGTYTPLPPVYSEEPSSLDKDFMCDNKFATAYWSEFRALDSLTADEVRGFRGEGLSSLPLYVLSSGLRINGTCEEAGFPPSSSACAEFSVRVAVEGPMWLSLQQDLANLSNASHWEIVPGAGTVLQQQAPAAVLRAIYSVWHHLQS